MHSKISHWKDGEIKKLFQMIEEYKDKQLSLSNCFTVFAKQNNRQPNSVRNYYYQELAYLEQDEKKCKKLKIDLSKHQKNLGKSFSEDETKNLVKEIIRLKSLGYSVRKACLKLANNDIDEMVRLQNKYRSTLATDKNVVDNSVKELKNSGFVVEDIRKNVTMMPLRKNKLTDSDINSLFLGLVNMVKKNALEDADAKLKREAEFANDTLRKTLVALNQKEMEIKKLRTEFKLLIQEKDNICLQLDKLKNKTAEALSKKLGSNKIGELETYLGSVARKTKKAR